MVKKKSMTISEKIKENPWVLSTLIFGVLAIVLLSVSVFGSAQLSSEKAGNNFVDFINSRGGAQIEYVGSKSFGSGLYEVTVLAEGQEVPAHITQDGKYFVQVISPLIDEEVQAPVKEEPAPAQDVVKADVPTVELFIWSYCPYGVQAQGPLSDVAALLGGKANFEAVTYYDGHGAYETQQNKIQSCIQEIANDKYWAYASEFVDNIYPKCGSSRDIDCDKTESVNLMESLGIDSVAVLECVESQGEALLASSSQRAKALGVTGSPSLVINGVIVQPSSRTADAFKDSICTSFNDAPEECGTVLDSTSAAASGNC